MLVRTVKIDPKDYPFRKQIEEQAHLNNDEDRHKIQAIQYCIVNDFKEEEHKYCDKEQLCPLGKFRRPKKIIEMESRGFTSVMEMAEADKKAEEDKKVQETVDLRRQVEDLTALVQQLLKK